MAVQGSKFFLTNYVVGIRQLILK